MKEVYKDRAGEVEKISKKIFDYLLKSDVDDAKISRGLIPESDDEKFNQHIKALNQLIHVSQDKIEGGIILLDRDKAERYEGQASAMLKCIGGSTLLDAMCNIVNSINESAAATPSAAPSVSDASSVVRHTAQNIP
jgi:hypothetical protein